jgi:2',3'-cyclic-nucleotide 2'-phosphodiesterase (5'-nucleotidase family)
MIQEEIRRSRGQYDVCILLSHVGTFADEPLAAAIPEIDVIISAHDHQLYPEAKCVSGVIMNSAGNYGEYVGLIELEVSGGKVELLHSAALPTRDAEMDPEIQDILKASKAKAIANLSEPLFELPRPLWHDVIEENPLSNLLADGLRDMLGCDIGLINSGIANAGVFGFLSNKKLIEICPSPLNPTSFEVQGAALRKALESSLDAQTCLADGRGPGFRGKFAGRLHVSGAKVIHDGKNVQEILIGSEPLEEKRWYTVASSDYLQRGSGYPALADNRNDAYSAEEIKDVIRTYAGKAEVVERAYENRWIAAAPAPLKF